MLYVVLKYVEADSVEEAYVKQKRVKPHEIYLSEKWKETGFQERFFPQKPSKVGFHDKARNSNTAN